MYVPRGVLDLREVGAPGSPPAGQNRLYNKTDDQLYLLASTGVEKLVSHAIEVFPAGKTVTAVYTGTFRVYLNGAYQFESVEVGSSAAITGTALVVDILKNGTTLWSTAANRPTIAVAAQRATMAGAPSTTAFVAGDYFTFSIPQIGSNATVDVQILLRLRRLA